MSVRLILATILVALAPAVVAAPLHFDTGKRWLSLPYNTPSVYGAQALYGRINGDAREDLVLYLPTRGEAYVAYSNGGGFGTPQLYSYGLPSFPDLSYVAAVVDVNGDGLDDFVVMNHGVDDVDGAATAVVAVNTGSGFSYPPNKVWNASWCASYQACPSGDINGDGKADLVAFTPNYGTVWGTLSTGGSFGENAIWNNYFCINGEVCALGDIDGDGKDDAVLFKPNAPEGQRGNVLWARSSGSGFGEVEYAHGYFCISGELCLLGDVNGDGRDDGVLVKGFANPTLEVLVSVSNGQQFINAEPFAWATPPRFGEFQLADVNGDGKADLVAAGATYRDLGGGSSTIDKFAVDVFAVTDQVSSGPTQGEPQTPGTAAGFSAINVYNCQTEQHQVYLWNIDGTTGEANSTGLNDAMYSEAGTCPDLNDGPVSLPLTNGHVHRIVAVDPQAIGCDGQNDPNVVGCAYNEIYLRGASDGPVCNWVVGAQAAVCQ